MLLTYENGFYIADCSFEDRIIPKEAGFTWTKLVPKKWATTNLDKAMKLFKYADDPCRARIQEELDQHKQSLAASLATDANIDIPCPEGLAYLPFQKAGIAYAIERRNTLIGDEPGLGKTIQAIGFINYFSNIEKVLTICPAPLKLNWLREYEKWLIRETSIQIISANSEWNDEAKFTIINYDILRKFDREIKTAQWDLLIVDEAHKLKESSTLRSKMVYGFVNKKKEVEIEPIIAERTLFLTGTPISNRPKELFPLISYLDPLNWRNFFSYGIRYCAGYKGRWGWDFSGSSNSEELQDLLRKLLMVRRLKSQVMKELPPKRRQIIEFSNDGCLDIIEAENKAWESKQEKLEQLKVLTELSKASEDEEEYREAMKSLKDGVNDAFNEISKLRHNTAVAKIPLIIEHVKETFESGVDKIILFLHHHDVVNTVKKAFSDISVTFTGKENEKEKQKAWDSFQNNPNIKLFIGSSAAQEGITLTASSLVMHGEIDWVPGNMSQREDRAHRKGQENKVLIQYLVIAKSLDVYMSKVVIEKQEVIEAALDKEITKYDVALPDKAEDIPITQTLTQKKIAEEAVNITPRQIQAVHTALRILAGYDEDRALIRNDIGYNKIDTRMGCQLAALSKLSAKQAVLGRKIIMKYHKQLPEELLTTIKEN